MPENMKAVVCTKYGPPEVLQLTEVQKPTPKDHEVRIRIFAVVVGIEDPMQRKGRPYVVRLLMGLTKPKKPILGTEFCGAIDAVGKGVTRFKQGEMVFGVTGSKFGCYAEYMCMSEFGFVTLKPPALTPVEAAPICGNLASWNLLKTKANIQAGQKVLIYGASGSIGSAAVQLAKVFGAEVTGVCSAAHMEWVRSLGADKVMDEKDPHHSNNAITYDIILEVSGTHTFLQCKNMLSEQGFFLTTYPRILILLQMGWTSLFGRKKVVFSATGLKTVSERQSYLKEIIALIQEGRIKTKVDQCFELEQMVEAHRYIELENLRGNVVVRIAEQ